MRLNDVGRQRIAQYVRGYLFRTAMNYGHQHAERRAEWRWMHTLNIVKNVQALCEGEKLSPEAREVCEVSAMFHDIDHYTVDLPYHGAKGAETAAKFLAREGYPVEFIAAISATVRGHHFDLDDDLPVDAQMAEIIENLSHEARILMDAETLDKIGANNILQSVTTLAATNNVQSHTIARELTSGWPLDRARHWAMALVTPTGKALGAQRLAFYEQFLSQIASEIVMIDPYPQPSTRTQEMMQLP